MSLPSACHSALQRTSKEEVGQKASERQEKETEGGDDKREGKAGGEKETMKRREGGKESLSLPVSLREHS